MFAGHRQSPIPPDARSGFAGLRYFPDNPDAVTSATCARRTVTWRSTPAGRTESCGTGGWPSRTPRWAR